MSASNDGSGVMIQPGLGQEDEEIDTLGGLQQIEDEGKEKGLGALKGFVAGVFSGVTKLSGG